MSPRTNRREFLKSSTLATTGFWVAGARAAESRSPNEKLNIGIIGVNHRGGANTNSVKSENIVALCDIDENYLAGAAKKFPKAKTYTDPGGDVVNIQDSVYVQLAAHRCTNGTDMADPSSEHVENIKFVNGNLVLL